MKSPMGTSTPRTSKLGQIPLGRQLLQEWSAGNAPVHDCPHSPKTIANPRENAEPSVLYVMPLRFFVKLFARLPEIEDI
jgi:hypothetical protein